MGLFDTIHCEYPLPVPQHQELEFQTKDLECLLDEYTITRDGRLLRHARRGGRGPERDVEWPIHADVCIYDSDPSGDEGLLEYVVRFTHGRVEWIRPLAEAANDPGPPSSEDLGGAAPDTEISLLANLRRERRDLEKLLAACDDHWGYEDPVYRFYHQSFKVYGLQGSTQEIVRTLQSLAPDRPLDPWFLEIVGAGTGKEFRPEDNAHWTEVTRPIVEAFLHARYFLEMAVRYADLDSPPRPLPSGYAALLELFGLR